METLRKNIIFCILRSKWIDSIQNTHKNTPWSIIKVAYEHYILNWVWIDVMKHMHMFSEGFLIQRPVMCCCGINRSGTLDGSVSLVMWHLQTHKSSEGKTQKTQKKVWKWRRVSVQWCLSSSKGSSNPFKLNMRRVSSVRTGFKDTQIWWSCSENIKTAAYSNQTLVLGWWPHTALNECVQTGY